jgi:hypothetical protein
MIADRSQLLLRIRNGIDFKPFPIHVLINTRLGMGFGNLPMTHHYDAADHRELKKSEQMTA